MKKIVTTLLIAITYSNIAWSQDIIEFTKDGYYPEGVAYFKAEDVFLLGSMTQGEIASLDKNGELTTFITDEDLVSPIGIKVNNEQQLLYVTNSDIGVSAKTKKEGQGKTAQLFVYDLKTKKKKASYNLASISGDGYFFANDLTYDTEGNIYLTNSFGPHIWKIDSKGKISIFSSVELFNVEANHFGLNGIVYHPAGYLLVAHYAKGALYKVSVKDPSDVTEVKLSFTPVGADGLELIDNNTLLVIANGSGAVTLNAAYTLMSEDTWESASISKVNPLSHAFPTTTTRKGKKVYVLYAYLDKMLSGTKPAVNNFQVVEVDY